MPVLPPCPATKTSLFRSFLVVMFSASKEGGSRDSKSYSSGLAPPPTHTSHPKVQPGSSFIVHERTATVNHKSLAETKGRVVSIHQAAGSAIEGRTSSVCRGRESMGRSNSIIPNSLRVLSAGATSVVVCAPAFIHY